MRPTLPSEQHCRERCLSIVCAQNLANGLETIRSDCLHAARIARVASNVITGCERPPSQTSAANTALGVPVLVLVLELTGNSLLVRTNYASIILH